MSGRPAKWRAHESEIVEACRAGMPLREISREYGLPLSSLQDLRRAHHLATTRKAILDPAELVRLHQQGVSATALCARFGTGWRRVQRLLAAATPAPDPGGAPVAHPAPKASPRPRKSKYDLVAPGVVAAYQAGRPLERICATYGLPNNATLYQVLRSRGVQATGRRPGPKPASEAKSVSRHQADDRKGQTNDDATDH